MSIGGKRSVDRANRLITVISRTMMLITGLGAFIIISILSYVAYHNMTKPKTVIRSTASEKF